MVEGMVEDGSEVKGGDEGLRGERGGKGEDGSGKGPGSWEVVVGKVGAGEVVQGWALDKVVEGIVGTEAEAAGAWVALESSGGVPPVECEAKGDEGLVVQAKGGGLAEVRGDL